MHDPCISMHFQIVITFFLMTLFCDLDEVRCFFAGLNVDGYLIEFFVSVMWSYFVGVHSFMIFFIWPSPFVSCCKRCHLWSRHLRLFKTSLKPFHFGLASTTLHFKMVDKLWRCLRDSFYWCWCSLHVTCVTVHLLLWRTPNSRDKHSPSFHSFSFLTVARYRFFLLSCLYISRVLLPRVSSSNYALLSVYSCV